MNALRESVSKAPNSHRRKPQFALFTRNWSLHPTQTTASLFPLDDPIFLWYSSFWVQLQLIPVLARAHLPLATKCTILCNVTHVDATLLAPSYVLQTKDL